MTKGIASPAGALLLGAAVARPSIPISRVAPLRPEPVEVISAPPEPAPVAFLETLARTLLPCTAEAPDRSLEDLLARATEAFEDQRYFEVVKLCNRIFHTTGDHERAAALHKDAVIVIRFRRLMAERAREAVEALRPAETPFEAVMDAACVNLDVQDWPLDAIVDELRTRTGMDIRLRQEEEGCIRFKADHLGLRHALTLLLRPRNLDYEIDGLTIWIGPFRDPDRY